VEHRDPAAESAQGYRAIRAFARWNREAIDRRRVNWNKELTRYSSTES
jgi:hypothetical protein